MSVWLTLLFLATAPGQAPGAPLRVVSMAPSLTDLTVELGAAARLVGVSRFDDGPAVVGLPQVGGYLDPDLEAVVRLKPDLVLADDGVSFAPTLRALRAAKLNVLALRTDRLEDVQQSLLALGTALGLADQAARVWADLSAIREAVRQQARGLPKIKCAIAVGFRPLMLAGRGSYLESLLEDAGGENVSSSPLAWPTASLEQLVASHPAVIFDGAAAEEDAASARVLALLRAQGTRIVRPSLDLFRPGPRALRALPALARALREAQ